VFTGDGDGVGIGGNHLIHAARRNIGLTVVLVNNFIYGMTGGQVAPTTPYGARTSTTPFGNLERPFDICKLMEGAGATYVARWTTFQIMQLTTSIKKALQKKGFAFVEVISQCPVQFGRRTGMEDPAKMMQWFKEISVSIQKAKEMSSEELKNRIIVGEFVNIEAPELTEEYKKLFMRLHYGKN
jgi:2-oxoglutarate ferredoxin oxidoreductase subunit beta